MSKTRLHTIQLDRSAVITKIIAGDNYNGAYYLAASAADCVGLYWADHNRPWNPWPDYCRSSHSRCLIPRAVGAPATMPASACNPTFHRMSSAQ